MSFGERVSPVAAIQAILHDYPYSASILRELLQNSDDAGATKQIFVLDKGAQPALIAYNDSEFQEADWEAIQSIHESSKKADTSKIGKYGVGFRACYHITDQPQILSGVSFAVLDPLHSNGERIEYDKFKNKEYFKDFDFFSSMFNPNSFTGTAIRLPLRSARSELSQRIVLADELQKMIADYISEELNVSLLFLDKLRTIEIWETSNGSKTRLATWTKSGTTPPRQDPSVPLVTYNTILSDGNTEHSWRIVQTQNSEDEAISRLSQLAGNESVNFIVQKHKLRSDVRLAYPLTLQEGMSGKLFTFLPLPSKTAFPIHIHALFALTSSRQSLRNPNETGIVEGSDNDVLIKWNRLLFNHYIPQGWGFLLKTLAAEASCNDIFSAWPPYCSSITSGDGIYWQDILPRTFKTVVESELKVWPKVSAYSEGSTTYVDLKSSLIVRQSQVDADVLAVLTVLGLTLVQLPQRLLNLVDDSMTKLSPSVAHGKLQEVLDRFDQLSADQRGLVCKYLLSDGDISNIFGLPLIPILNGSFVALEHRNQSLQRFIALTKSEVAVFETSACDAIPLDQLSPEMARLLREQGTNQANVDLLSPQHVIEYMSKEAKIPSNERLTEFWCWVVDWHLKKELIDILKANEVLQLLPTTNGPQPVPSLVFNAMENADNARLFGKLGLAFIISVLPISVFNLLLNYGILKNASDLNHFLTAVNLDSVPSLTDDEAKMIFNHIMGYHGPVSPDALAKLRKLPIFPVMVPAEEPRPRLASNSSVIWRSIHEITIKGISPLTLIPIADETHFLSESNIRDTTSSILKKLHIPVLKDEDVLLRSLELFTLQPKPLQAAFVSYMRINQYRLPNVQQELQKTAFLRTADGSLQSPENVIDPGSPLAELFPQGCKDSRIPMNDDEYDRRIFEDFRALRLMKTTLEATLVQERISYISSNSSSPEATTVALSLLKLMNKPSFYCHGLYIDPTMSWLPTANGLITSKQCINGGRRDTDLYDEVLVTLDESVSISPSFKGLLDWDKPLPLEILAAQLGCILDSSVLEVQSRKIRNIIKELSNRKLSGTDVQVIRTAVDGRAWIPTKSGQLAQPSRVVFVNVDDSSGFHEAAFSKIDKESYQFLCNMGCLERPTAAVIIEELKALQEKANEDGNVVQPAVVLLEMLPGFMTEEELASLLVPDQRGCLIPLSSGIRYYSGGGRVDANNEIRTAHHLVTERLAEKLRMGRLGLEAEDDIDLGGKPITTIRNTLKQYTPEQFFTEFIANASDAKAKQFSLLIDDHEGPTDPKKLFSAGMTAFQSPSLVVYNDSVFDTKDFRGIRDTGIGGKREKSNVIGYFGLGALSMFHFTELAMIVSGGHVLFLNPAKHSLRYRDRSSVLLPLQQVKRLYRGHLEPLDGLFGFNLNSTEFYQGTIFRLPLRKESHLTNEANSVSLEVWSTKAVEDMLQTQFDNLAYKSLLFTGVTRIDLLARRDSQLETLRSIEVTRQPDHSIKEEPFESEIATFTTMNVQKKWLVLSKPVKIPEEFGKALEERSNILPVKVAAALDDALATSTDHNLFCTLPLPVTTSLPVHISAPFLLEQERRNIRLDDLGGMGSQYNRWLLKSEIPSLYLYLLETLLSTQGTNKAWWPPTSRDGGNSSATQTFIDAFWTREMLTTSPRRIFASRTNPSIYLAPKDAVVLDEKHGFINTLSKIVDICQPAKVVGLSGTPMNAAFKAGLHFIDPPFVRDLLQDNQACQQLDKHERKMTFLFLSSGDIPLLHGLPLLPLEDGSFATISFKSDSDRTYYVLDRASGTSIPPFSKDRLIHQEFKEFLTGNGYHEAWQRLLKHYNVSLLSEEGIIKLTKESIEPSDEFVGDHAHEAWVNDFWRAKIAKPQVVSQFPLVSTFKPLHYISFQRVNDPSVIVLEDAPSELQSHYSALQKLGLVIVVRQSLPSHLRAAVKIKELSVYASFLSFVKEHPDKLKDMRQLTADDPEDLGSWIRSQLTHTPKEFSDIACQVPVWPVQQGPTTRLAALKDDDVTILPQQMPVTTLCPFTNYAIMNWKENMKSVKIDPCTTARIVELLRVSAGTVIRPGERDKYKEFIDKFLKMDKVGEHPLLVPNSSFRLRPASDLFETAELFVATFKSDSPCLLSQDFQHLAQDLEKYGLKRQRHLDLPMFIECAAAFDSDRDRNKRTRGEVLYRYFNTLRLSPEDTRRCGELENFRFIPRIDKPRPEYGVDTIQYIADNLPRGLLTPAQITIPDFEAIYWSQKGKANPSPNKTLCGTYQSLGKPDGSDVVAHLLVLAEIGRDHGRHRGLLADLKATYRWLNDHADNIAGLIFSRRNDKLFLNVDDPESDEWVWDSASKLVIGLQDVRKIREVKGYLRNYSELLKAAGVRRVQRGPAQPIPAGEDTSLGVRGQFNNMRQTEFGTDVVFVAQDSQNGILPAHKVWLIANNNHFRTMFVGSGMMESQGLENTQSIMVERSSMCVQGVVDWFYVGNLPETLTNSSSGNDEEAEQRLNLALEMLSLSDEWEVTDLHQNLQAFIINNLVNPYSIGRIRGKVASTATELLDYCQGYEEANQSIIDDFASGGNEVEDDNNDH